MVRVSEDDSGSDITYNESVQRNSSDSGETRSKLDGLLGGWIQTMNIYLTKDQIATTIFALENQIITLTLGKAITKSDVDILSIIAVIKSKLEYKMTQRERVR